MMTDTTAERLVTKVAAGATAKPLPRREAHTRSFTGELEHLPIVDVVQLLHSTRKSGILRVASRKGESQLVFKDGYIVSANHLNSSVRIGKILVDLNIISQETLAQALQVQLRAGKDRKPLIVTLIERGVVDEEDAYRGLEQLIELTLVEILTWKKGTFTLEVLPSAVSDEYRYYPERISREVNVDTQVVLMDTLRIFDEKMRDGKLAEKDFPEEEGAAALQQETQKEIVPSLSMQEQEELAAFLGGFSAAGETAAESARSVVFLSPDQLIGHAVRAVCRSAGIPVSVVSEERELDPILVRALAGNDVPILIIDAPRQADDRFSPQEISSLRQRKQVHYPEICVIQLAASCDAAFTLKSYSDGVRAVLPRPSLQEQRETYVTDTIQFMTALRTFLMATAFERESFTAGRLKAAIARLPDFRDATTSVTRNLLECVAGICERSLILIVRDAELVADKGIGISGGKAGGVEPAPGLRIPLARPSLLCDVIEWGFVYYGPTDDEAVWKHLFAAIGPPSRSTVLLLPLRRQGKTVALAYGDFGGREPVPLDGGLLEILASQAELVLESAFYRKNLTKNVRQGTAASYGGKPE
jgi:hypothetical protein